MSQKIIIVGGGIAGLSLAYRLEQQGADFLLIDSGKNESSLVAGGIINPLVFRRMALSWRVDDFLPEAKQFYSELEQLLNQSFFHSNPIRRAFAHEQERDLWIDKCVLDSHKRYMKPIDEEDNSYAHIKHKYGTGVVKEAYRVDTKIFIEAFHSYLKKRGCLLYEQVDYADIDLNRSSLKLRDSNVVFDKLIFCQGYQNRNNPFFSYLPIQCTKGEVLTVKCEKLPEEEEFNYKCFVLPLGKQQFKVGATYSWNSPDTILTEEGKQTLLMHFENLVDQPYELLEHEAGVRPTVLDRRPIMGQHPNFEQLYIYNGLGTKGYMLTPQLSKEFVAYLLSDQLLDKDIDVARFLGNNKIAL